MPVILPQGSESLWLDPSVDDPGLLDRLLRPYDSKLMEAYEVSPLVNSAANNMPEVSAPVV